MALAAVLIGVLLVVAALIVWQHAARAGGEVTFGVEDAVEFVSSRLPAGVKSRVREGGIRRILEWEIFYLQGLAQENRREPVETVAGDYGPAVEFIHNQIARSHDRAYSTADIGAVLALGVAYLESIGAVGEEAGGMVE